MTKTDEPDRLRRIIERDRTLAARIHGEIKRVLARYEWLSHSRGSYEFDDPLYQQEFGHALDEIRASLGGLHRLAKDLTDCPVDLVEITRARRELGLNHLPEIHPREPAEP